MKQLVKITPMEKDFSRWYVDVVINGGLASYGPSKGSLIFKPLAYGLWDNIRTNFEQVLKKIGSQNVYLPLLIPTDLIKKERDHVKGFAPELYTVTEVGDKQLAYPLAIRPTSEVLFSQLFAEEISSYHDLPLIYNQWVNVCRGEKKTNPFLRTSEFLWQEGHSAHAQAGEARKLTRQMIRNYARFLSKFLAIPTVVGKKTPREKFAGAVTTYSLEAMMKDGKALQSATSHYLGQNFAKTYAVKFKNQSQELVHPYQTSWGMSTRLIGAIIMAHGDNRGVIMPPRVATYQIDLITLFGDQNPQVLLTARQLFQKLSRRWRVRLDTSSKSPGFKAAESEIQGVPLRIEIGPREIQNAQVVLVRRDTLVKTNCDLETLPKAVEKGLAALQQNLFDQAQQRLRQNTVKVNSYAGLKEAIKNHRFVLAPFAGKEQHEEQIQAQTGATARCLPFDYKLTESKKCILTGVLTRRLVLFARAY